MRRLMATGTIVLMVAVWIVAVFPGSVAVNAQTSLPDLVQRVKPSVAWVKVKGGCGSAFAVDPSGLLVTALHVVGDTPSVSVQFPDSDPMPADVVAVDVKSDLAILRVARQVPVSLPVADNIRVGQDAIIIGYPLCMGPDPTVTKGIVSGLNRVTPLPGGGNLIQIDAAMNPGNSGGPVLTSDGAVVGVADQSRIWVSRNLPAQGVNFAVPFDAIKVLVAAALDPSKPHVSLALPLQAVVSVPLQYKGSANGYGRTVRDAVCVSPPPGALALSSVHGELKSSGPLAVKTVLALRTNPDESSAGAFGVLEHSGARNVQTVSQQLPELPARDVCLSFAARSPWALIALGFEVSYTLDYKVWSSQVTGEPLPVSPSLPAPQPAPGEIVTWTTQPNGPQVRVAIQIAVPSPSTPGVRQNVKVVSIGADGQTETVYENIHDAGETVSVAVSGVPPFVVQVYIAGTMVKQITVPSRS